MGAGWYKRSLPYKKLIYKIKASRLTLSNYYQAKYEKKTLFHSPRRNWATMLRKANWYRVVDVARPKSKTELLKAADTQYSKLISLIESMSDAERTAPLYYGPDFKKKEAHWRRDTNLRDILGHLYEWHQLLLNWATSNQAGKTQSFLPEPYTWKNYCNMNIEFCQKHKDTPYEDSLQLVKRNHRKVLELIESFTDKELFEKAHFNWTGTTTLGSYCISATSSHYDWAIKKIQAHIKALKVLK